MVDSWRIRYYHPHEVGMTERWTLSGVDKNAPQFVKDALRHYSERYNGPVGFFESVNDALVGSVSDSQLTRGGVGVRTNFISGLKFDNFTVTTVKD